MNKLSERLAGAAALLMLAASSTVWATDFSSEASVAASFVCPETLKDDAERATALQQFMSWIRSLHPDWSAAKITGYRLYLLERNNCSQTLAKFHADPSSIH
jgi:hypothetical protein